MIPPTSSNSHRLALSRQIQLSGFIALLLFVGVVFLGISFYRQSQAQSQSLEVGTVFSDRSVSQLQRELLRLRTIAANPSLSNEEAYRLQIDLARSRFLELENSLERIQPPQEIINQYREITAVWAQLTPLLTDWQALQQDVAHQAEILARLEELERMTNNMISQYERLRLVRGQTASEAGKRSGLLFAVFIVLFLVFIATVIYNFYRFVQESVQAEKQLALYATELERSNIELQQFAYVASHDLQEPLRKIRTFGDRLQMHNQDRLDGRSMDYIIRMNRAAMRMQTLIEDLLTFSRVKTQTERFVQTDLNVTVREVMDDLETRLEELHGQIVLSPLPTLEADPIQMRQLLQNLIGNGLKFHQDNIPPIVTISGKEITSNGRTHIHLFITDNGIGIEKEHQERIFHMFQRLHGHTAYEGTGIGLAICRRIAERHGGSITVHSQPNQGTTFMVTLPARQNP